VVGSIDVVVHTISDKVYCAQAIEPMGILIATQSHPDQKRQLFITFHIPLPISVNPRLGWACLMSHDA
jgi:hypothetical protein